MGTIRLTLMSDTHNKHKQVTGDLPGGDILLHSGDLTSMGYEHEIREFCKWFSKIEGYTHKIFIAGNHDWGFQDNVDKVKEILDFYSGITYLQDSEVKVKIGDEREVKIYGAPWQPDFHGWAFNLPKNGPGLSTKWEGIPDDCDILLTHGPAFGILDTVDGRRSENLGCELLAERLEVISPKIHLCGHIHTGYGYVKKGETHHFNSSVLNERYTYSQKPMTVDWNPETNELEFV
jgi:predicted MPP superfamily phosphohydrolase